MIAATASGAAMTAVGSVWDRDAEGASSLCRSRSSCMKRWTVKKMNR